MSKATAPVLLTALFVGFVGPACKKQSPASGEDKAGVAAAPAAAATSDAAPPSGTEQVEAGSDRIQAPFLWQVKKGDRVGYLLGTMHMGVDAEKLFPQLVWDRLKDADRFCMEANIKDPRLVQAVMRQDNSTLDAELGPELWKKFQEIVGPSMAEGFKRMKVSGAASMLAMKGLPMTPPMDLILETKAKGAGVEVTYLEDAMFQMEILDKYMDLETVRYMIENHDELTSSAKKMLDAYVTGDAEALDALMNDEEQWKASGGPEAKRVLLIDRNADWVPKYEALMAKGTPFCAVGAGHLVGDESVIALLEDKGYEVTRLSPGQP